MKKTKSILRGSIVAATTIAVSGLTANAAGLFNYNNLGTGEEVRSNLSNREESSKNLELKCGEKGSSGKKGKQESKQGGKKHKKDTANSVKGGQEGKCGGAPSEEATAEPEN